jgi:isocitrate dehydrogenase
VKQTIDSIKKGKKITLADDASLVVPDQPIIPYIEGDGIGSDIMAATHVVLNEAIKKSYGNKRSIAWTEVYAGEKANKKLNDWLPEQTLQAFRDYKVGIKGPLTTPVGGGIRSLNVTIRQKLDLFACVRPTRWFRGVGSPVKNPEEVNMVVFRENTEDVYSGVEWQSGSKEAKKVIEFLNKTMKCNIVPDSGIGIKPISPEATYNITRKAIKYAIDQGRKVVTLVHKGNIMKFTEGSFKEWGYELAAKEFPDIVISEDELWKKHDGKLPEGKIKINDRIADMMFQQVLLRPSEYDVIVTPNLNGDYISDALAAQVGGLGMAPGANLSDDIAVFEATHGTAPKYAKLDKVNPSSLILSGVMMLQHLGWHEAAEMIIMGIERTILSKRVTYDLARMIQGAVEIKCSEFAQEIVRNFG